MDNYREFQGSDLDDCIQQAMEWFNSRREMLEVEILQDAKTGIFGIVGARKAKIRARKAQVVENMLNLRDDEAAQAKTAPFETREELSSTNAISSEPVIGEKFQKRSSPARPQPQAREQIDPGAKGNSPSQPSRPNPKARKQPLHVTSKAFAKGENRGNNKEDDKTGPDKPAFQAKHHSGPRNREKEQELNDLSSWPVRPIAELDQEKLKEKTLEIVSTLVTPLAGKEIGMQFDIANGSPRVRVEWEGDAGLLIGRDGQTLIAVQYLASRLLSHSMSSSLRVRLDIGDYRARQGERLRELALNLAEKARANGRPYSTRPLTSYHRRVIHMALQDATDIQTRSAGDGPLKRVIISSKRT